MTHDIIFQMEIVILLGYAQIAAALSGFIGVAFVFARWELVMARTSSSFLHRPASPFENQTR